MWSLELGASPLSHAEAVRELRGGADPHSTPLQRHTVLAPSKEMGCKRKPFIPEPAEGAETPLKLTLLGEKSSASQSSPSSTALGQAAGRVLPVHACARAWAHHLHNSVCHCDKSRLAQAPATSPVSLEVAWLLEVGFARCW